jgi:radical SAM superfamily enzyme YgiQ (UPF0313 family)
MTGSAPWPRAKSSKGTTTLHNSEIYYCEPVYRPPSEALSLLIQATEGCTYRCTFCVSNTGKKYRVRPTEDIQRDLDTARRIYGGEINKLFFLDGNAMGMPFEQLLEITRYAKELFPNLRRASVYAHAKDILNKSEEELRALSEAGLKMAYIGIETGNNHLLQKVRKRQTADDLINAFHKCFKTGITPSGTIILGLAGKDKSLSGQHMKDTALLVNRASPANVITGGSTPPWYISCLALMIPPGTPVFKEAHEGTFIPMNSGEILQEMKILLENISDEVKNCIFRSNHASNYLALQGILSRDRDKMLAQVDESLHNGTNIRPEKFRGL